MFRALAQAFFGRSARHQNNSATRPTAPSADSARRVVLYAHVAEREAESKPQPPPARRRRRPINHREWLYAMQLRHLKLCSPARCDLLENAGIVSAGDLMAADIESLARHIGATETAARTLKRFRRAIRLAASISGMMPNDAILLFCIHRRSPQALAIESAVGLHRDLQRFALSTRGQRRLRGRRVPSIKRLRRWIASSKAVVAKSLPDRQINTPSEAVNAPAEAVDAIAIRPAILPQRMPVGSRFAQPPGSVYA